MFSLLVRFSVLPGQLAAFDELVATTIQAIRAHEPETVIYLSHSRADHAEERVFYEAYRDHDAFLQHESTPHTRHFLAQRQQHLAAEPEVWWLTTLEDQVPTRT